MRNKIILNHTCKHCGNQQVQDGEPDWLFCPECDFDEFIEIPEYNCHDCNDSGQTKVGISCQSCCPHDDRDHGICIDCEQEWSY